MSAQKSTPHAEIQGSKSSQPTIAGAGLSGTDAVGVDKIRDLLFGNQMQDYDRRFTVLEERLLQKLKDVETETSRNLGSLESSTKKIQESLANQLREEKDLRLDGDKELDRNLRENIQTLEKRLGQLSDQLARLERDLTDRLDKEAHSLRDEIKRKNAETHTAIERMFTELSNVKTDRNLLAGLFIEVAKCLKQDFGPRLLNSEGSGE